MALEKEVFMGEGEEDFGHQIPADPKEGEEGYIRQQNASPVVTRATEIAANSNETQKITANVASNDKRVSSNLSSMSDEDKKRSYEDAQNLMNMKVEEASSPWLKEFFVKVKVAAKEKNISSERDSNGQFAPDYSILAARLLLEDKEVLEHLPEDIQKLVAEHDAANREVLGRLDATSNAIQIAANSAHTKQVTESKERSEGTKNWVALSQLGRHFRQARKQMLVHEQLKSMEAQLLAERTARKAREELKKSSEVAVATNGRFSDSAMQKALAKAKKEGIVTDAKDDGTYYPAFLKILEAIQKEEDIENGKKMPTPPEKDANGNSTALAASAGAVTFGSVAKEGGREFLHGITGVALGTTRIAGDIVEGATGFMVGFAEFLNANAGLNRDGSHNKGDLSLLVDVMSFLAFFLNLPFKILEAVCDWADDKTCSPEQLKNKRVLERNETAHKKIEDSMAKANESLKSAPAKIPELNTSNADDEQTKYAFSAPSSVQP